MLPKDNSLIIMNVRQYKPEKCFLHVKAMKTGSTTIDVFLRKNNVTIINDTFGMQHHTTRHSPYSNLEMVIKARFGDEFFDKLNLITCIREPIARAESWCAAFMNPSLDCNEYVRETFLKIVTDEEFLAGVDFDRLKVFKTEDLTKELKALAKEREWKTDEVPEANTRKEKERKTKVKKVIEFTDETKDLIRERFKWTIDNYYS